MYIELRDPICNPHNLIEKGNGQDDFDKKASTSEMWQVVVVALGAYNSTNTVATATAAVDFLGLAGTAAGTHMMIILLVLVLILLLGDVR
mgnify:CR=1 FL=1